MTVKAKFTCGRIEDTTYKGGGSRKIYLNAVYGNSEENKSFSNATPSGILELVIDKETPAYEFFVPGNDYYLTFEAVQ